MEIKTIWQPVPPWPEGTVLKETKYPVAERLPRLHPEVRVLAPRFYKSIGYRNSNEMRKWIVNG
jgi:hypothetical protein